jgi:hypothetical protein
LLKNPFLLSSRDQHRHAPQIVLVHFAVFSYQVTLLELDGDQVYAVVATANTRCATVIVGVAQNANTCRRSR